jgi:hypothetical protein
MLSQSLNPYGGEVAAIELQMLHRPDEIPSPSCSASSAVGIASTRVTTQAMPTA